MEKLVVGVIGCGVIGQRWAAAFAHAGYDVRAWDPDAEKGVALQAGLATLLADLDSLKGKVAEPGSVQFFESMAEALSGVDFVQENGPEKIETKRLLLAGIEKHVAADVVIASSSSALLVTEMQADCQVPARIVLGHPFNPAHIMPLVEIVGGRETAPEALSKARALYDAIGKKPVTLNREITGHLALRLMGAMWREAIALVRDGVASVEDVDRAFMYGPGPKWTLQGSFISNQLNATGMDDFLHKYGPTYQAIWDTLLDAKIDEETIAIVNASTADAVKGRSQAELKAAREEGLVEILRTVARRGAL